MPSSLTDAPTPAPTAFRGALDRRSVHRVEIQDKHQLSLLLETASRCFEAEVADLSIKGVGIRLPPPESGERVPALELGEQVRLVFLLPDHHRPLTVSATVRFGLELAGARRYGFEFESELLATSLPARFLGLLTARSAHRAQPLEELSVALQSCGDASFTAHVNDISSCGMGVLVEPHLDVGLGVDTQVVVSLQLPAQPHPLELVAWIRYRNEEGEVIRYGLEFDQERTEDFKIRQAEITDFVLSTLAARDRQEESR